MPPQPGLFNVPYSSSTKARAIHHDNGFTQNYAAAGPSRTHGEDGKRDKKRKELAGKLGKEMNERRDEPYGGRHFAESINTLLLTAHQLSVAPSVVPLYELKLYPLSLERSALLAQTEVEEKHALEAARMALEEERERVEDEWKRGRERVRERLLEGIEERRRRAREEKDGEGTVGDTLLDSQSRPLITRKLRNKVGGSPPGTPSGTVNIFANGLLAGSSAAALLMNGSTPLAMGPLANPHSLVVEEIPSPFPLALTATTSLSSNSGAHASALASLVNGASATGHGRRRAKGGGGGGGGGRDGNGGGGGGLGKSLGVFGIVREGDNESDLGEIRRASKRRRVGVSAKG